MWIPPDVVYLAMTVALFLPWFTRYTEPDAVLAAPEHADPDTAIPRARAGVAAGAAGAGPQEVPR